MSIYFSFSVFATIRGTPGFPVQASARPLGTRLIPSTNPFTQRFGDQAFVSIYGDDS